MGKDEDGEEENIKQAEGKSLQLGARSLGLLFRARGVIYLPLKGYLLQTIRAAAGDDRKHLF